jgi:hypothetical protein
MGWDARRWCPDSFFLRGEGKGFRPARPTCPQWIRNRLGVPNTVLGRASINYLWDTRLGAVWYAQRFLGARRKGHLEHATSRGFVSDMSQKSLEGGLWDTGVDKS